MHILQLANFYQPRSGGIRICLDELARGYLARGHACSLLVPDDHDAVVVDRLLGPGRPGRTVVRVKAPLVPGLGGYRMVLDRQATLDAITNLAPDVIELSDKTTLAGAAAEPELASIPTVLISHERLDAVIASMFSRQRIVRAGIARFNRRLADRVDVIVCASRFAADEFREAVPESVAKLRHIPLGVDLDVFSPSVARPPRRDGDPLRIVTVVRLSPEKEPVMVVDTVRELTRRGVAVEAVVYGDGPLRDQLTADAIGLPLRFAGHLASRRELAAAIRGADVAIAPGPHETFGLGGLELLASGVPIVVPDRGSLPELIDGDVGRAVPSTAAAFADAVIELASGDVAERRRAARARASEYRWDAAIDGFVDLYAELLGTCHRLDRRVGVG